RAWRRHPPAVGVPKRRPRARRYVRDARRDVDRERSLRGAAIVGAPHRTLERDHRHRGVDPALLELRGFAVVLWRRAGDGRRALEHDELAVPSLPERDGPANAHAAPRPPQVSAPGGTRTS